MIDERQKKWRAIEQKVELRYESTREQKEIDRKALELRKKPYFKLREKERKQLIAEMILYCSPKVVWVTKRNSKQPALRNEKGK
jgi:hypothetical protein